MTGRGWMVRAPAKINLHLGVGAPRPDGFHPLVTVYQAVGLYDDVSAEPARTWSVELDPRSQVTDGVPVAGDNIVDAAGRALARLHGRRRTGRIRITKAIPVAGGMAGGSADAAAALVALDRLWGVQTSDENLLLLAAGLGSDVPFALLGGTALGTGRGEIVEPVTDAGTWWWVIVRSPVGLSTPAVYRRFDELTPGAPGLPPGPGPLLDALASGDARELAQTLHNDLQRAALDLRPELAELLRTGTAAGAARGIVSGSGPTCVFLCDHVDAAQHVALDLRARLRGREVLIAGGPVAGAHVVSYG